MLLLTNKKKAEIGKLIWIANLQWFIAQLIVSLSWKEPGYSWKNNMISDLGNTVISPLAGLMNFSFILTGILSVFGALFLRKFLFKDIQGIFVLILLTAGAIGIILVGLDPENLRIKIHLLGANIAGLTVVAIFWASILFRKSKPLNILSKPSLYLSIFLLFVGIYYGHIKGEYSSFVSDSGVRYISSKADFLGLGAGGMERLLTYPLILWQFYVARTITPLIKNLKD
jgi:hypothetical protein